jgi:hypothetical protein
MKPLTLYRANSGLSTSERSSETGVIDSSCFEPYTSPMDSLIDFPVHARSLVFLAQIWKNMAYRFESTQEILTPTLMIA